MNKDRLKIKTITCHDVYNVGASLQAFALARYLLGLGHDVEIIDYKPAYLRHYTLWGVKNPRYNKPVLREAYNILKLPGRLRSRASRRKKSFDRFTSAHLPLTAKTYFDSESLKREPPAADVYFAGSDQIWNTLFQNGKDPAFYLDFAPDTSIRASYAASFATEEIAPGWKDQVRRWLERLDFISVREQSAVEMVQGLGLTGARKVVDPVFLLSPEEWRTLAGEVPATEDYLLIYDFDGNEQLVEQAKKIAAERNWKIYSVFSGPYCDRCFADEGPLSFVRLVANAKMILSNSFHATAFSILFEKPFIVYDRAEKINTRMQDLLRSLGITMDGKPIDFASVRMRLEEQIRDSKRYIDEVLCAAERGKQ